MKASYVALAVSMSIGLATPAFAEKVVYACQYTESVGFDNAPSGWKPTNFKVGKPFFLEFEDGSISYFSVGKLLRGKLDNPFDVFHFLKCPYTGKELHICLDDHGRVLNFNSTTLEGAVSDIFSAGFESEMRHFDLYISTFTCTKVE